MHRRVPDVKITDSHQPSRLLRVHHLPQRSVDLDLGVAGSNARALRHREVRGDAPHRSLPRGLGVAVMALATGTSKTSL